MSIIPDTEMPNCSVKDAQIMSAKIQAPRQCSSPDSSINCTCSNAKL